LKEIKDALPPYVSFDDIRLVAAHLRAENRVKVTSAQSSIEGSPS